MTARKRPLLPAEDRARLLTMAANAERHKLERGGSSAYAQGVADVLNWIAGNDDMTPMLTEVTR